MSTKFKNPISIPKDAINMLYKSKTGWERSLAMNLFNIFSSTEGFEITVNYYQIWKILGNDPNKYKRKEVLTLVDNIIDSFTQTMKKKVLFDPIKKEHIEFSGSIFNVFRVIGKDDIVFEISPMIKHLLFNDFDKEVLFAAKKDIKLAEKMYPKETIKDVIEKNKDQIILSDDHRKILKSFKYPLPLFELLMSKRNFKTGRGKLLMVIDEFREFLDIPKGYRNADIKPKVMKNSIEQLKSAGLFINNYELVSSKKVVGKKITSVKINYIYKGDTEELNKSNTKDDIKVIFNKLLKDKDFLKNLDNLVLNGTFYDFEIYLSGVFCNKFGVHPDIYFSKDYKKLKIEVLNELELIKDIKINNNDKIKDKDLPDLPDLSIKKDLTLEEKNKYISNLSLEEKDIYINKYCKKYDYDYETVLAAARTKPILYNMIKEFLPNN